ncbi:craniofacial development protein 2-like [Schistocerca americana]|uniref:craniofacial development protein 2-like n=1 Tax=Schistocerca americana TaxID=7009 RepID=UPI001F5007A8|nr:craniofacial development protein 2-like [Schistocerca americana]
MINCDMLGGHSLSIIIIIIIQETRWLGEGTHKEDGYKLFYGGCVDKHDFGTDFVIHDKAANSLKGFKVVNKRISYIVLGNQVSGITFINVHAPTEDKTDEKKEELYDQLEQTIESTQIRNIRIVLGDFNGKSGKGEFYIPTIGRYSLHDETNENGQRMINLTISKNLRVSSTYFEHKRTWCSLDGRTTNQIEHILVDQRYSHRVMDVRSYRGADCASDHFLIVCKLKLMFTYMHKKKGTLEPALNVEKLRESAIKEQHAIEIKNRFEVLETLEPRKNVEERWKEIQSTVLSVADNILGRKKTMK